MLGGGSDDSQGAGQLLKPYITRGEIQLIGATTAEYVKHILPDKAFASRFHEIKIDEPTKAATKEILIGLLPVETEFFNKEIQMDLLDKVIELSNKYSLDQIPERQLICLSLLVHIPEYLSRISRLLMSMTLSILKLRYNIYISENKLSDTREGLFQDSSWSG